MTALKFRCVGHKTYTCDLANANAVIFGSSRPFQLWAWALYWHGGTEEGIEMSFAAAKTKINWAIERMRLWGEAA